MKRSVSLSASITHGHGIVEENTEPNRPSFIPFIPPHTFTILLILVCYRTMMYFYPFIVTFTVVVNSRSLTLPLHPDTGDSFLVNDEAFVFFFPFRLCRVCTAWDFHLHHGNPLLSRLFVALFCFSCSLF